MTPRALERLSAFLSKTRGITTALRAKHHVGCLRDDTEKLRDMLEIIGVIERCCRRRYAGDTYLGAIAVAIRSAVRCFKTGQFSHPFAATKYLSYLFEQSNKKDCRYQEDLETFFWRLRERLSQRYNRERRKAERLKISSEYEL